MALTLTISEKPNALSSNKNSPRTENNKIQIIEELPQEDKKDEDLIPKIKGKKRATLKKKKATIKE
jgi:hypothetical protein